MRFKQNVSLSPPVIGAFLSIAEVAKIEGVSEQRIRRLCRRNMIYPIQVVDGRWRIGVGYVFVLGPHGTVSNFSRRGRPPGAKNKRPYPKGVKRPRVKKEPESRPG